VSHNGVLIPRYVSLLLPGAALAATAVTSLFLPARYWKAAAASIAVVALLLVGSWTRLWLPHGGEGWREAAKFESESATESTPVLCPSPFIEGLPPVWTPNYHLPGFLYANLAHYPLHGRALLLPFARTPESDLYLSTILNSELIPAGKFLIYGQPQQVNYVYAWLESQPELTVWHTDVHQFESTFVIVYSATSRGLQ
jgi:hypothetical protein